MDAYWRDGRDITQWDVLLDVARAEGLDAEAGLIAVESGEHARAVDDSTDWARSAGITGVRAFYTVDIGVRYAAAFSYSTAIT
jgi:predicted DsbA family dithiol-disulfide isomerase